MEWERERERAGAEQWHGIMAQNIFPDDRKKHNKQGKV